MIGYANRWRMVRNLKRVAQAMAIVMLSMQLSGCWFIFIPTGLITNAIWGSYCVSDTARVGDRVSMAGGSVGEIVELNGTSTSCNAVDRPIRAKIRVGEGVR